MRHGESVANHERRWVSDPQFSISGYGLTDLGMQQIRESVSAEIGSGALSMGAVIIASDFRRARESAEIARELLGSGPVSIDVRLRERGCGEMEGRVLSPDEGAQIIEQVTLADRSDPFSSPFGLERASDVLSRVSHLLRDLEEQRSGESILLVCHFDLLRIALCAVSKISPGESSRFGHISNGGIFHLNRFLAA
jgi:probable phosphoglycerate mutase